MASMNFTAGRLLCGEVRSFLDKCKFKGMDIEYLESSGWLERDFTIKGSDNDILAIHKSLKKWSESL